jgi:hypothetical protein
MFKLLVVSLFFSLNAFAQSNCLDYEIKPNMYFETLTNYLFSSEDKTGVFFDYLKASDVDTAPLHISPYPLVITGTAVKLLVVIEKDGTNTCALLRVPIRKMCDSVGLEYYGRARLFTDPVPQNLLSDMEQELCRFSTP